MSSWTRAGLSAMILVLPWAGLSAQVEFRPLPDLGFGGYASDISSEGVIVGAVVIDESSKLEPAVWQNRTAAPQVLPTGNLGGFANAVNSSGMVVGSKFAKVGAGNSPASWVGGVLTDLPTLGEGGQALDVNDSGVIVGYVRSGGDILPAMWIAGELKLLTVPAALSGTAAIDVQAFRVNARGTIVGTVRVVGDSATFSVKWVDGVPQSAARENWLETRGIDIDDADNILVNGYFDPNGSFTIASYAPDGNAEIFRSPDFVRDIWGTSISGGGIVTGYYFDYSTVPAGLQAGVWRSEGFVKLDRPEGMRWALPITGSEEGTVVGYVSDGVSGTSVPGYWLVDEIPDLGLDIEVSPVSGFPGERVVLFAKVTEEDQPVSGEVVTFELGDAVIGSAVSDSNGVAQLRFAIPASAKAGNHDLEAWTSDGEDDAAALDVKWVPTRTSLTSASARPGQTVQASGTLTNELTRAPLRNQSVNLRIQGTDYVARTNNQGRFSVSYRVPRTQRRGSAIPVQATFAGNVNHAKSTVETSIRIR